MNSYFKINRDYRETYLKELKQKKEGNSKVEFSSKYPHNVNFKDFVMYMIHPTLVYQDHFPLIEKRSIRKIATRFVILMLSFVRFHHQYHYFQLLIVIHLWDLSKSIAPTHSLTTRWCRGHSNICRILYSIPHALFRVLLYHIRVRYEFLCWIVGFRR